MDEDNFKVRFKKRCFHFSIALIALSDEIYKQKKNWVILDQAIRSGTSIGANVVEGGSSISKKEFINYFQIALKSASETLYWLAILKEINPSYSKTTNQLIDECSQIKKLLTTIIIRTKKSQ